VHVRRLPQRCSKNGAAMKPTIIGRDTALKRELAGQIPDLPISTAICLDANRVSEALATPGIQRLVLRGHAYAYGSSTKNPGLMTEDRVSLLPPAAPEQRWVRAEEAALRFPNTAVVRLTNVLDPEEGDLIVQQISSGTGKSLAGFNPNVQFISVRDAARALAAAARSSATGVFNATGPGAIPLAKVFRAAGTARIPFPGGVKMQAMQYNWTV